MSFSSSAIDGLSLSALLVKVVAVTECAERHLAKLERYQVTRADVDALRAYIAAIRGLSAYRTMVKNSHTENTGHPEELFDALRKELKLMDTQVKAFVADEEFLKTYFIARRVHDVRSGKKVES